MAINGYINPAGLEQRVYTKLYEIGIAENSYPIDPFELINKENIILQETSFDNDHIRGMLVCGPNVSGILINSNRSAYSKRFIAMHELSHYWFHPHETKRICFEDYSVSKKSIEWQANNAAAYALMPTKIITEQFYYCNGDIDYLCDFFKVGKDTVTYRLTNLNLMRKNKDFIPDSDVNFINQVDSSITNIESQWLYGGL